jgi:S-formylglutathione hydrolase FrmB
VRNRWILIPAVAAIALSGCGEQRIQSGSSAAHGAQVLRYSLDSKVLGKSMPQTVIEPSGGGKGRPMIVFLHGRGGSRNESNVNAEFMNALAALGTRAPNVVFPSGDEASYWHSRSSGDWPTYVLNEVIPEAVRKTDANPNRLAIGGISMGGWGAFNIARLAPGRFCAVGGHSAAFWQQAGDSAPAAFDNAEDFQQDDLIALAQSKGRSAWGNAQLWMDGGANDPFRTAGEAFSQAIGIKMKHWPGGHSAGYWHAHYAGYLGFYANALANCRG